MAEFTGRDLRVNELASSLTDLRQKTTARVAMVPTKTGFTTLPDGRVLDAAGNVIYTPTPVKGSTNK